MRLTILECIRRTSRATKGRTRLLEMALDKPTDLDKVVTVPEGADQEAIVKTALAAIKTSFDAGGDSTPSAIFEEILRIVDETKKQIASQTSEEDDDFDTDVDASSLKESIAAERLRIRERKSRPTAERGPSSYAEFIKEAHLYQGNVGFPDDLEISFEFLTDVQLAAEILESVPGSRRVQRLEAEAHRRATRKKHAEPVTVPNDDYREGIRRLRGL